MDVRELMTAPVQTLTIDDTLSCAAKTMRDHAIGCVPIVDRRGVLVGILTDRDIALAAYEIGEALPVDFSAGSRAAMALATTLARPFEAAIELHARSHRHGARAARQRRREGSTPRALSGRDGANDG